MSVAMPQTAYGFPVRSRSRNFEDDIISLPLSRRYGFLELDGRAAFDHLPIVRPHSLGNIMRMNIEVGFTADLVARNKMAPFIFAINQYITEFEILHENDGCGVVHDVLQSLFAITQRLLGPLALLLRAERCNAIRQVVRQVPSTAQWCSH